MLWTSRLTEQKKTIDKLCKNDALVRYADAHTDEIYYLL